MSFNLIKTNGTISMQHGKQSVSLNITPDSYDESTWFFCTNGWQSTGVKLSLTQFDMVKDLVNKPEVVDYYENIRNKG